MGGPKLRLAEWPTSITVWRVGEDSSCDVLKLPAVGQWCEDRWYYTQRKEARRCQSGAPDNTPHDRKAQKAKAAIEVREEHEFEVEWFKCSAIPYCTRLKRQRGWLFRALIAREAIRALVCQWRRQPGHWAGVRRDLGLDRLTPQELCGTATPAWRSAVVAEAADGWTGICAGLAISRWKEGLNQQRRS
jgi:hypothetical protein